MQVKTEMYASTLTQIVQQIESVAPSQTRHMPYRHDTNVTTAYAAYVPANVMDYARHVFKQIDRDGCVNCVCVLVSCA